MKESYPLGVYHNLPETHTVLIGKLITTYAFMERYLITIIYGLSGLSREMGDLVVRQPRLSDIFEMIDDICVFKDIKFDANELKDLKQRATAIKKLRDAVAHNTFLDHPDYEDPLMVSIRGNWNKSDRKIAGHRSKAVRPHAEPLTVEKLLTHNLALDKLAEDLRVFMKKLGLDS